MESLESYLQENREQLHSRSPYPGHYFRFLIRAWVDSVKREYITSAKMIQNAAVALVIFAVIALPFKWKATAKEKELEGFIESPKSSQLRSSSKSESAIKSESVIKLISIEEPKVQLTPSQVEQTIFLLKQLGVESTISEESVDDTYYRHPKSPKS